MDFDKFGGAGAEPDPTDPIALYDSLDKQFTHVELRPAQQDLLKAWVLRRNDRDVVLKLATGAGKTTVGLLALYSHMVETRRPCMFLCPTNQLVEQVVHESERCGIPSVAVLGGSDVPPDALAGNSLVITSIQSIFQARSGRFNKCGFYAILVDDAHAAVEIVRSQFQIDIPRQDSLYKKLFGLFRATLREQSRGSTEELEAGVGVGALEVPYWTWNDLCDSVTTLLSERAAAEDKAYKASRGTVAATPSPLAAMPLTWGLIKNCLHGCRCFFSAKSIQIAPEVPPVERVASYHKAERRIFMSATISDESVLVRELGCGRDAASQPVELPDAGGLGERMVLVPRLMAQTAETALGWADLAQLCKKIAERKTVVVLTPTYAIAKNWSKVGATVVERSQDVPAAVAALRNGTLRFVAFANRYDGLDLPDEACRLLVLDGAPIAYALMDSVDMTSRGGGAVRRRTVMHRIEQGLGRGVRSPADFAAVALYGNDIVQLISMASTRQDLTDQTRKQIELGIKIAQEVKQDRGGIADLETLIWQCLNRDSGWKRAYQNFTKTAYSGAAPANASVRIAQAVAERDAWSLHISNRGTDAATTLRDFLNNHPHDADLKAFLLQRVAWYLRKDDPAQSLETQVAAREHDLQLLMPPSGVRYRKGAGTARPTAEQFVAWLNQFDQPNAAVAALDVLRSRLTFAPDASHEQFEQALCDLGTILGFESRRPDRETGGGPDVLWLEGQIAVPLEAKNRTSEDTDAIAKHVAAQLMQAEAWTKQMYADRPRVVPVSVHTSSKCGDHAIMPTGSRVLTPEHLSSILDAIQVVASALGRSGGAYSATSAGQKLTEQNLGLSAILNARTAKPT